MNKYIIIGSIGLFLSGFLAILLLWKPDMAVDQDMHTILGCFLWGIFFVSIGIWVERKKKRKKRIKDTHSNQ